LFSLVERLLAWLLSSLHSGLLAAKVAVLAADSTFFVSLSPCPSVPSRSQALQPITENCALLMPGALAINEHLDLSTLDLRPQAACRLCQLPAQDRLISTCFSFAYLLRHPPPRTVSTSTSISARPISLPRPAIWSERLGSPLLSMQCSRGYESRGHAWCVSLSSPRE